MLYLIKYYILCFYIKYTIISVLETLEVKNKIPGGEKTMTLEEMIAKSREEGREEEAVALETMFAKQKKTNDESASLRRRLREQEEATNKTKLTMNALMTHLGLSVDDESQADESTIAAKIDELKTQKKAASKDGSSDNVVAELNAKINESQRQLKQLQKEAVDNKSMAEAEKQKRISYMRENAITKELVANNAIKPQLLSKIVEGNIKLDESGEGFLYATESGDVPLSEGIKSFLETNPDFVSNPGRPGSGSSYGGKVKMLDVENMSQEEYNKCRKEGKIQ